MKQYHSPLTRSAASKITCDELPYNINIDAHHIAHTTAVTAGS